MSGFVCEAFGYIPRTGETIKVVLERENEEENDEYEEAESDRTDQHEKSQIFKLEVHLPNRSAFSAANIHMQVLKMGCDLHLTADTSGKC